MLNTQRVLHFIALCVLMTVLLLMALMTTNQSNLLYDGDSNHNKDNYLRSLLKPAWIQESSRERMQSTCSTVFFLIQSAF